MGKVALITGITGQDGSYLAEYLLKKGYEVHGLVRRTSSFNRQRIDGIFYEQHKDAYLHYGDMTDMNSLIHVTSLCKPDEIYNLAAQSHVQISFDVPYYTALSDAIGVQNLLESVRILGLKSKFYQASTSELFSGDPSEAPQSEKTPFKPRSPYGAAKLYGYEIARIYRESYGFYVCNGILFNHESPRRGSNFVTRKITRSIAAIVNGTQENIPLGNMDAKRDWGYAPEYVESMHLMMQQSEPGDYVIATGETHSVREFAEKAFACVDIEICWEGSGREEKGIDAKTGKTLVVIDPQYFRPNEVDYLCGDASNAKKKLGWEPTVKFEELVRIMMDAEMKGEGTN
ncbi:GDP-mannose 4,6-dehydratase [Candidatus Peregrinibacteria bacterium CG10_big_fil_rev_8_21_14_0_10_49_24]|nr:MAG: GDP-mannose 4,6-dehydratase [Candidatus Peregrinibacteria bacterium CG11_big_fil_rev_8_21_14_0_20_49_14]PIR51539.1 MAG: GDP-mannose 4,6-dehydratase [Candidatus Peregrinibacteria bacterium CG10_big_fil_rev_8_21_14_0_10_49_24]PJA67817.1 MAG: GDP-mannose 4,6-dehydratase [Candidatus Peregrinibacteria bacterium CG_4_9_14_3_um_filter_49_12]